MILFYLLLGYLLFRFITGFVIPVFRITKNVREQFSRMNPNQGGGGAASGSAAPGSGASSRNARSSASGTASERGPDASKVGEYIDFEEVKP